MNATAAADSLPAICGAPAQSSSSDDDQFLKDLRFWGPGVSVSVIGGIGLVGNVLSIIAIATFPQSKLSLFYKLLLTLAIFDSLFITNGGLFMTHQAFAFDLSWYNFLFPKCIYPISGFAMTGSTYLCVLIAMERYLGICHSNVSSRFRKLRYYMVVLVFLCLAIDSPRFFEIESVYDDNGKYVKFQYTSLRRSRTYILAYFMWYRLITTVALPFLIMLFCNIRVFLYYKRNSLQTEVKQERTLLIIFTCISATFLICHTPRMILNVYEFKMDQDKEQCLLEGGENARYFRPRWTFILACVEKVLLILNASANFIYYCFAGREFRRQFCKTLLCCSNNEATMAVSNASPSTKLSTRISRRSTQRTSVLSIKSRKFQLDQQQQQQDTNIELRELAPRKTSATLKLKEGEEEKNESNQPKALDELEKWRKFVANQSRKVPDNTQHVIHRGDINLGTIV